MLLDLKNFIAASCGGVQTSTINCSGSDGIFGLISFAVRTLTNIFFVAAVLLIVFSGFQLATSAGEPKAIEGAKKRITNVVISIVALLSIRILAGIFLPGGDSIFN